MKLKIIDLFAGIGGIRLGFEKAAKKKLIETNCVFSSEIDKYCIQTYITNFGKTNFYGDITKLGSEENIIKTIPNFDLLFAGFPCQPFSQAGLRKGFNDTRGTLFFWIEKILNVKKPDAFLLENVKLERSEVKFMTRVVWAFRIDFDALIAYTPAQQALALSPDQLAQVPAIAAQAQGLAEGLGIQTTLENFMHPERLKRGEAPPPASEAPGLKGAPCLKAWHYLVVQADGKTSPCCVLAGQGGSVAQTSVKETWESDPFMNTVRDGMMAHQPLPRCTECSWNILQHEARIREAL